MITAKASPCAANAGEGVQLNRGGERFAVARLDSHCVAHFFARVAKRATFRAFLPAIPQARSRRLVLAPAQAQGSR
jgi:hypothetical protein